MLTITQVVSRVRGDPGLCCKNPSGNAVRDLGEGEAPAFEVAL
jgi:hypothetical protein